MIFNVCEIFLSLQGESTFSGLPCIFIRLSGCNLNCTWCDTVYAKTEKTVMTLDNIMDNVKSFDCDRIEITGGEPLVQTNTPFLIKTLLDQGYTVLLETNGSLSLADIDTRCIRIMDIKCPSSGEADNNDLTNLALLGSGDEVKFVVADQTDYLFARDMITTRLPRQIPPEHIHLSPVFGSLPYQVLAEWMLRDNIDARLSLQLHKLIWDPETRGV